MPPRIARAQMPPPSVTPRPRRSCREPALWTALPIAPAYAEYGGPRHAGGRIVECRWQPTDGVARGAYLDAWISPEERATMPAHLGGILTMEEVGGRWLPATVAKESIAVPDEWGLFCARAMTKGEIAATMLDGAKIAARRVPALQRAQAIADAGGLNNLFLYDLPDGLYDGRFCRPGGARCANDARNTPASNTAELLSTGCLVVRRMAGVQALRAEASNATKIRSELCYDYGDGYWAGR